METTFGRLRTKGLSWRLAGGVTLALAVILYRQQGGGWLAFGLLLLAPDLGALGYLAGARAGARGYNLLHNYSLPLALLALATLAGSAPATAVAAIWLAHIGMDRIVGYGLKAVPPYGAASPARA